MRPHVLLAAALVVLAATAGCSDAGEQTGAPALGPLPQIRSQADLVLPLDHYLPSPRERAVLATARSELTARCMEELGFTGYPVDSYAAQTQVPLHGNDFGVFDETNARTYGFGASFETALLAQSADLETRFAKWDSADARAARGGAVSSDPNAAVGKGAAPTVAGVPAGGCEAEGPRRLYAFIGATAPPDLGWIDTLQGNAFAQAAQDERLRPVTEGWSRCMKDQGYDYATPSDANNDPRWIEPSGVEESKRVAVADVRCKWSSGYIDTYVGLVAAYEQRLVEKNAERLQDALDTRKKLLSAVAAQGLGRIREAGGS